MAKKNIQKQSIQEILNQGMRTEFWELMIEYLNEGIERLREKQNSEEMRNLPASQYKVENEILIASIENLKDLKSLPQTIIDYLEDPNAGNVEKNFDPYYRAKDLQN